MPTSLTHLIAVSLTILLLLSYFIFILSFLYFIRLLSHRLSMFHIIHFRHLIGIADPCTISSIATSDFSIRFIFHLIILYVVILFNLMEGDGTVCGRGGGVAAGYLGWSPVFGGRVGL